MADIYIVGERLEYVISEALEEVTGQLESCQKREPSFGKDATSSFVYRQRLADYCATIREVGLHASSEDEAIGRLRNEFWALRTSAEESVR
jgi:hypothetical protein